MVRRVLAGGGDLVLDGCRHEQVARLLEHLSAPHVGAVGVSAQEPVLGDPGLKAIAIARNRVPRGVERVVAIVIAVGVRGTRTAGREDDGTEDLPPEALERGHAVAVLPFDPQRNQVVLIEQFRIGALGVVADRDRYSVGDTATIHALLSGLHAPGARIATHRQNLGEHRRLQRVHRSPGRGAPASGRRRCRGRGEARLRAAGLSRCG